MMRVEQRETRQPWPSISFRYCLVTIRLYSQNKISLNKKNARMNGAIKIEKGEINKKAQKNPFQPSEQQGFPQSTKNAVPSE